MWGGIGVGVGWWVWVWAWRIQLLYKTLHRLYQFIQSVIFCHSLCGLLNKLEGVGSVCGCGCEELWVWGGAFEEVGVGRWVWWVWGGGYGCAEVGVDRCGGCEELWVWGGAFE